MKSFEVAPFFIGVVPPYIILSSILCLLSDNNSPLLKIQFIIYNIGVIIAILMAILMGILIGKNIWSSEPVKEGV